MIHQASGLIAGWGKKNNLTLPDLIFDKNPVDDLFEIKILFQLDQKRAKANQYLDCTLPTSMQVIPLQVIHGYYHKL